MYKLLISDFENTLIDNEDAIPLSTMLAIDEMRNQNISFTVITNGNLKSILDYNKDFPFVDYIIAINGSYIYDVKKEKTLWRSSIGISIIKKIKKVFDEYNLCFYTLDWCNYTKEKIDGDNVRKIGDFNVFSAFHKDNIFKVEIYCNSKKEQGQVVDKLEELNLDVNYYIRSGKNYFVEIIMSDCSRYHAITKVCKVKKASVKDAVMIGFDDDNIESFKKVGMSVAVSNASSKLRKVAKEVVTSNNEKAVEQTIKEYF